MTSAEGGVTIGPAAAVDQDRAYRALAARDQRFDGRLWYGVTSTGVYCRPVCPARTPRPENVRVFASPAAAVASGYRACRRCRPDAQPGTRDWDHRRDLAARAVRMIAAGVVDEAGVTGLAARLHVSQRHLHRTLVAEVGTGPLQLALSRRAQTARLLVDETDLVLADVAFAAGFASVRQFNDVMRREFGRTPSQLRALRGRPPERRGHDAAAAVVLRLRRREPYDVEGLLATRSALGRAVIDAEAGSLQRLVRLPAGPARLRVDLHEASDHAVLTVVGAALGDLAGLVSAVRRWLDLDADPAAVGEVLRRDPLLRPLVRRRPGLRAPAALDPWEGVLGAVLGQRVSTAAAAAALARLTDALVEQPAGEPLPSTETLPAAPPDAATVAAAGPDRLGRTGLPAAQARALCAVAEAVAAGRVQLGPDADREQVRAVLGSVPGIGPWTVEVVALRALADPDAFPVSDLVLRRAAHAVGIAPSTLERRAEGWRPWRAYAAHHLWRHDAPPPPEETRP